MTIDTNIKSRLTKDEQEVFAVIRNVIAKYTPSTQAFAVGGWTRDKLLGVSSDDIDIMIDNVSGEDFAKLVTEYLNLKDPHVIKENPEASKHITTAKTYIPLSSGKIQEIDFAQARKEVYKQDSRIPEIKNATPQEDAFRRDLTINSLFYDINREAIADYTGKGLQDLSSMTIRTPEDPLKTFSDDPLRIFRVIRFAAKYNGQIDPQTYAAMTNPTLRNEIKQKISKERIGVEFTKMLKNPNAQTAIALLKDTGLLQDIVSEALRGSQYEGKMAPLDMEQKNAWHKLTVWGHTMEVVKRIMEQYKEAEPEKRVAMILAALMHDLGKLFLDIHTPSKTTPGNISYIGHERESRNLVNLILKYLKMEPYMQEVAGLARYHMRPHQYAGVAGANALRKFIRQMGEKSLNWLDIFNLSVSDAYAKDVGEPDAETVNKYQKLRGDLQSALDSLKPTIVPETETKGKTIPKPREKIIPVLNGNEVMKALNIKAGPWMTEIMEFVKELRDEKPNITKEEAIAKVQEKYQGQKFEKAPKTAKTLVAKEDKIPSVICPMHLLQSKIDKINELYKTERDFEILTILKQLKNEYGRDEKITRLIASVLLDLLIINSQLKDNELLIYLFDKAKSCFFDTILCSYVLGLLLLLNTKTKDDVIKEMGSRMAQMAPELLKSVLNKLPPTIAKQQLKKEIEELLM